MARESGGRGDKDGNEFERLWVAYCMLEVLGGHAQSLKWEPPSDEAEGGELILARDCGWELHQCKIGNKSHGKWKVTHLQQKEVLSRALSWLSGDVTRQFHFVSRDRVAPLDDLVDRALRYEGNDSGFVRGLSRADRNELERLSVAWGRDWAKEGERSRVLELLRRMRFSQGFWGTDRRKLEALAESAFIGSGRDILDQITSHVYERLGQVVYASELRSALAAKGHSPRDLRHDQRIPAAIERLQNAFVSDLESNLIGGSLIQRTATQEIIDLALRDQASAGALVVGGAGSGKSTVLLEIAREFRSRGVPFLPIRFDIDRPESDLLSFSADKLGLPGDPVACLQALSGDRRSVLILDQLDAIRWTAAHAAKAMQVVGELIERARSIAKMVVVAACRTFDLEDDRRLRALFPERIPHIHVGELRESVVLDEVRSCGIDPESLPKRELQLLRSAFTLGLWVTLARGGLVPDRFSNRTELLKAFWAEQRRRLREERAVSDSESSEVLNRMVDYLDQEGRLDAPRLLVDAYALAVEALLSLGLLQTRGSCLRFGHQAHADYLIAQRVVERIVGEGLTLVEWVQRDQSLFRREQIRQALQMLRDTESREYNAAISGLLTSTVIRFHVQQLVLQVLRHASEPTEAEIEVVAKSLRCQELRSYVCDHLLLYSYPWTKAMLQRGILGEWLESGDSEKRKRSIRMLGSCAGALGDDLDNVLVTLHKASPEIRDEDLVDLFSADASSDSPLLFAQRLRLIAKLPWFAANQLGYQVELLVEKEPLRALSLVHAAIVGALDRLPEPAKADSSILLALRQHEHPDTLISACLARPSEAFDLFLPIYRQVLEATEVAMEEEAIHFRRYEWYELRGDLQKCLSKAARELALTSPDAALRIIYELLPAPEFDCIAASAWMSLDEEEYADSCIEWLLAIQNRFAQGWDLGDSGWLGADLIFRFAAYCSGYLYDRLEYVVISVRSKWEIETVKEQLQLMRSRPLRCDPLVWADGLSRNQYGWLQQVLLEALPVGRRSVHAGRLVAGWRSKFGIPSRPTNDNVMGGSVGSPIPFSHLMRVSDSQWLAIVRGDWDRRIGPQYRQTGTSSMSKRAHETFAADFGEAAKRNPKRFSKLALKLEGPARASYIRAALWAIGDPSPPNDVDSEWSPASPEMIEQLVVRGEEVGDKADSSMARPFCSAVSRRAVEKWPPSVIHRLACYAKYAVDPEPGSMPVRSRRSGEDETDDLESSALNCIRGSAVHAMGALIANEASYLAGVRDALRSAACDPHPAVRIAVQAAARRLLKIDPLEAIRIFLAACNHEDERVLASSDCRRFLLSSWRSYTLDLAALFERMVNSEVEAAAQLGAECATAAWLYDEQLEDLFRQCEGGTVAQRIGVASVSMYACSQDEAPKAEALIVLTRSMNDTDLSVSRKAAEVFSREAFLPKAFAPRVATAYARSEAFLAQPNALVHPLVRDLSQASRFIEPIRVMALRFGELSGRKTPWNLDSEFTNLILGLYESTDNREIRGACLDAFDALLRTSSPRIQHYLDRLGSS